MPGKVAYIMSRFPHLPETFILREMMALEQLGWRVELYPLILQHQELVHPEARPWLERAHSVPWLSLGLAAANIHQAIMHPRRYFSLWARLCPRELQQSQIPAACLVALPAGSVDGRRFLARWHRTHPCTLCYASCPGRMAHSWPHRHPVQRDRACSRHLRRKADARHQTARRGLHRVHFRVQPRLPRGRCWPVGAAQDQHRALRRSTRPTMGKANSLAMDASRSSASEACSHTKASHFLLRLAPCCGSGASRFAVASWAEAASAARWKSLFSTEV